MAVPVRYRTTWSMIFGNFGNGYMIGLYAAWLPGYLEIQRHISIPHTGWLAAIPYVFGIVGSLFGGWAADRLVAGGFSPVNSRKLPIIVGMVGAAGCTIFAVLNRGRDARYRAPPAQNRMCGIPAYGSHLGCLTAKRCSGQG